MLKRYQRAASAQVLLGPRPYTRVLLIRSHFHLLVVIRADGVSEKAPLHVIQQKAEAFVTFQQFATPPHAFVRVPFLPTPRLHSKLTIIAAGDLAYSDKWSLFPFPVIRPSGGRRMVFNTVRSEESLQTLKVASAG